MDLQETITGCTVRIVEKGGKRFGTGFFVAPGLIVTCAHVVEPDGGPTSFAISGKFGNAEAVAEQCRPSGLADLALLRIGLEDHPVVLLGGALEIGDPVWTLGFVSHGKETRLVPSSGTHEGELISTVDDEKNSGSKRYTLIKFKGGQIVPGMSGSALVNTRTMQVCGVVARTRNEQGDAGGLAVPFRLILACYPEIIKAQSDHHSRNPTWKEGNIVLPSSELSTEQKEEALLFFPEGPGLTVGEVPHEIMTSFFTLDAGFSGLTIAQANNLRLRSLRRGVPPYSVQVQLSDPGKVPIPSYWLDAFTTAAGRGPRMLAALLYAAPPGTLDGLEKSVAKFLSMLRTWPIR
ncbi:hypothetical protein ACVINW_001359 [Bradyrhizobium sp. USDA 4461]